MVELETLRKACPLGGKPFASIAPFYGWRCSFLFVYTLFSVFQRKWEAFRLNWLPYLWLARDTLLRRRIDFKNDL